MPRQPMAESSNKLPRLKYPRHLGGGERGHLEMGLEAIQSQGSFHDLSLPAVDRNRPLFLRVIRADRFTLGTAIV